MDPFTLLVVIGAAGLGGCVQGLTGFGSTVVALPLLGLALPVRDAVALGCLMALATNLILVFRLYRSVNRPALTLLVLASLPGMVAGAFVLRLGPDLWLKALLGLTVGGLGLASLCRVRLVAGSDRGLGVVAGLAAGCLGVAIGINGPPVVAWAARQDWPRPVFLATLNAYFLLAGAAIVGVQAAEGLLAPGTFGLFAAGLLAVLIGVRLGQALCGRLDDVAFRRLVSGLLVVIGAALLCQVGAAMLARPAAAAGGTSQLRPNMLYLPIHYRSENRMLRKRAFDALRTDVLAVDAEEMLEAVADNLGRHLEKSPDMDAVVVTRQGKYLGVVSLRTLLGDLNDCALDASLRTSLGPEDFETAYRDACNRCMHRKAAEAARRDIPKVPPSEPLHRVLDAMIKVDSRFAVVLEGDHLLGLVPLGEIFRELRRGQGRL